eukprot:jgi/Chlat1/6303/Chrsp44S09056
MARDGGGGGTAALAMVMAEHRRFTRELKAFSPWVRPNPKRVPQAQVTAAPPEAWDLDCDTDQDARDSAALELAWSGFGTVMVSQAQAQALAQAQAPEPEPEPELAEDQTVKAPEPAEGFDAADPAADIVSPVLLEALQQERAALWDRLHSAQRGGAQLDQPTMSHDHDQQTDAIPEPPVEAATSPVFSEGRAQAGASLQDCLQSAPPSPDAKEHSASFPNNQSSPVPEQPSAHTTAVGPIRRESHHQARAAPTTQLHDQHTCRSKTSDPFALSQANPFQEPPTYARAHMAPVKDGSTALAKARDQLQEVLQALYEYSLPSLEAFALNLVESPSTSVDGAKGGLEYRSEAVQATAGPSSAAGGINAKDVSTRPTLSWPTPGPDTLLFQVDSNTARPSAPFSHTVDPRRKRRRSHAASMPSSSGINHAATERAVIQQMPPAPLRPIPEQPDPAHNRLMDISAARQAAHQPVVSTLVAEDLHRVRGDAPDQARPDRPEQDRPGGPASSQDGDGMPARRAAPEDASSLIRSLQVSLEQRLMQLEQTVQQRTYPSLKPPLPAAARGITRPKAGPSNLAGSLVAPRPQIPNTKASASGLRAQVQDSTPEPASASITMPGSGLLDTAPSSSAQAAAVAGPSKPPEDTLSEPEVVLQEETLDLSKYFPANSAFARQSHALRTDVAKLYSQDEGRWSSLTNQVRSTVEQCLGGKYDYAGALQAIQELVNERARLDLNIRCAASNTTNDNILDDADDDIVRLKQEIEARVAGVTADLYVGRFPRSLIVTSSEDSAPASAPIPVFTPKPEPKRGAPAAAVRERKDPQQPRQPSPERVPKPEPLKERRNANAAFGRTVKPAEPQTAPKSGAQSHAKPPRVWQVLGPEGKLKKAGPAFAPPPRLSSARAPVPKAGPRTLGLAPSLARRPETPPTTRIDAYASDIKPLQPQAAAAEERRTELGEVAAAAEQEAEMDVASIAAEATMESALGTAVAPAPKPGPVPPPRPPSGPPPVPKVRIQGTSTSMPASPATTPRRPVRKVGSQIPGSPPSQDPEPVPTAAAAAPSTVDLQSAESVPAPPAAGPVLGHTASSSFLPSGPWFLPMYYGGFGAGPVVGPPVGSSIAPGFAAAPGAAQQPIVPEWPQTSTSAQAQAQSEARAQTQPSQTHKVAVASTSTIRTDTMRIATHTVGLQSEYPLSSPESIPDRRRDRGRGSPRTPSTLSSSSSLDLPDMRLFREAAQTPAVQMEEKPVVAVAEAVEEVVVRHEVILEPTVISHQLVDATTSPRTSAGASKRSQTSAQPPMTHQPDDDGKDPRLSFEEQSNSLSLGEVRPNALRPLNQSTSSSGLSAGQVAPSTLRMYTQFGFGTSPAAGMTFGTQQGAQSSSAQDLHPNMSMDSDAAEGEVRVPESLPSSSPLVSASLGSVSSSQQISPSQPEPGEVVPVAREALEQQFRFASQPRHIGEVVLSSSYSSGSSARSGHRYSAADNSDSD